MTRHKFVNPSSSYNNFIPEEIVEQVLTRVPVKSLLRFKCVSKSWLALITSPFFVKTQLKLSSSLRIMSSFQGAGRLEHRSSTSLMATSIDFPGKNTENKCINFVGSCNGLVCITIDYHELFIWNPLTEIYKKLPLPPLNDKETMQDIVYGFGYNESHDDYKVVCVFVPLEDLGSKVTVYSSKTDSWNMVGDIQDFIPMYGCNVYFFGGKILFQACPSSEWVNLHGDLVSFDLENKVYETIEQPDYGEFCENIVASMGVFTGCFYVLRNTETCAELWVMKECGVKASWSRTLTPYIELELENRWYSKPLVMLPSGEILLVGFDQLVVYNPKDETTRVLVNRDRGWLIEACSYVESLVSPITQDKGTMKENNT